MSRLLSCMAVALVLLVPAHGAFAIDTERAFDDPALQARYENLTHQLRCLVCQNETIADSNATLAGDLRREVREMIAAGKTDDEISQFMLDRYGDFVLYKPRMTTLTFLLWAAPILLLAIGAFAVLRFVKRRVAEADVDTEGQEEGRP
jgi:cytochrome c-type biogenesis protein CcmH